MFLKSSAALATAVAALFLIGVSAEQAAAQRDGGRSGGGGGPSVGGGGGGGGGRSFGGGGGGGRSFSGGGSVGRSFGGGGRDFGRSGGYDRGSRFAAPRDGVRSPRLYRRADGRHRNFRRGNGVIVYGAPYYDGGYGYGSCSYFYSRAIATNSPYWWNRYYGCVGYW